MRRLIAALSLFLSRQFCQQSLQPRHSVFVDIIDEGTVTRC